MTNLLSKINLFQLILISGLAGIALSILTGNLILSIAIISLPLLFVMSIQILKYPILILYTIFTLNYFILGVGRYVELNGVSFLMDILMGIALILIITHTALSKNVDWKPANNILTAGTAIWMLYCLAEIANPSGMVNAWVLSRGLVINGFIITVLTSVYCARYKSVKTLLFLLSIFSLMAVLKCFQQKYIGFDYAESKWLRNGGALTHLIGTGTRYFSFFTDAGNFGSNMGAAGVIFGIVAISSQRSTTKIYYSIVAICSLYAMLLSGTRGAMIVPLGGLALYTIISKNVKSMVIGSITLMLIYIFFAFTMIGQGNAQIRRMRTAFRPSEDASFNVRKENQKVLADHLKDKPFGEGLGLSGVENQKTSIRLTTLIPHDSWYVKIWVETGVVGIILYLGMLYIAIARGAYILMFKIRNQELKGILTGLLCGITGLLLSAYGNAFWGQYPTHIIAFMGLSLVLKGEYFDKELVVAQPEQTIKQVVIQNK